MLWGYAGTAKWSPTDKAAQIVLSDGNLTATPTGGGIDIGVRTSSMITHKTYFEATFPQLGNALGVANASMALIGDFLGATANGIGVQANGNITLDFSIVGAIASGGPTDAVGIAVDPITLLLWARLNGGNWNGDPSANPATGTNGIDISLIAGALFAMTTLEVLPITGNFGGTAYAAAAPSGFGNL